MPFLNYSVCITAHIIGEKLFLFQHFFLPRNLVVNISLCRHRLFLLLLLFYVFYAREVECSPAKCESNALFTHSSLPSQSKPTKVYLVRDIVDKPICNIDIPQVCKLLLIKNISNTVLWIATKMFTFLASTLLMNSYWGKVFRWWDQERCDG